MKLCLRDFTFLSQIIVSFALGVLFSFWSYSLFFLILFFLIWEFLYFLTMYYYDFDEWSFMVRVGVCFAYLAGWIVGRNIYKMDICFVSPEVDHVRGTYCSKNC